jgi:hypothetical protein
MINLRCGHPSVIYKEEEWKKMTLMSAGLVPRGIVFLEYA